MFCLFVSNTFPVLQRSETIIAPLILPKFSIFFFSIFPSNFLIFEFRAIRGNAGMHRRKTQNQGMERKMIENINKFHLVHILKSHLK